MANEVAALGLKVDPSGIAEGIKALDDLAARGPKAEKAMDGVGESAAKASKSLKTLGQGSAKGLDDVGQAAPKAADSVGRLSKSAENANSSLSKISSSAAGLGKVATASTQSAKSVESLSASLAQTQKTLAQMQAQLQAASVATATMGRAQSDAARNATGVAAAYKSAGERVSAYARAPEQAAVANQRLSKSMEATASAARLISSAFAISGIGLGASQIIALSDGYTKFTAQLKLATKSASDYAVAMEDVQRIAYGAQAGLSEVGTLYARIANGTAELGLSQQRLADITEVVALSLKVSGATAAESSSAMLQLSQAFASGVLRGEEFNAVNESAPRLMKALAEGIGVPIGALRKMAEEGKLTSSVLADALPKALEQVRTEADKIQTIGGAFTNLNSKMMEFVGGAGEASGAAKAIANSVLLVADNLGVVTTAFGAAALVMTGRYVGALTAAAAAKRATAAAADATAKATTAASRAALAGSTSFQVMGASATTASFGVTAMAGATRAASAALAFFGGPIGLAITALGVAAAYMIDFGNSAEEAKKRIGGLDQPLADLSAKLKELPAETRLSVVLDFGKESEDAAEKAKQAVEDLRKSVAGALLSGDLENNRELAKQYNQELIDTIKNGGNLIPVLQSIAEVTGVDQKKLEQWHRLAGEMRALGQEAEQAKAKVTALNGEIAAGANVTFSAGTADRVALEAMAKSAKAQADAALDASKAYKSQSERIGEMREVVKQASVALDALIASNQGASKEADLLRGRIAGANEAINKLGKSGATKSVDAVASSYKSLSDRVAEYIAQLRQEVAQGGKVTNAQKMQIQLDELLASSKSKVSKAALQALQNAIKTAAGLEQEAAAAENAAKAYEDGLKWKAEWYAAQGKNLEEIKSANDRLREEIQLIGLSQDAQQALERSRIEATLAVREQHLAEMQRANDVNQFSSIDQQNLEMEIALLKERLGLLDDKRVRTANVEAAKKLEDEWNKTAQTVGDTLADYIMGGGKDAAQYLKRLFSTLVLEPIVKTGATAVMQGLGFGGQQSGAAGGGFDILSAGKGLWDAWSGGTGGMLATAVSGLGSLTGSVFLGELGSAIAAGVELGISGAAALTSSASATTTAGMWLGAAAPWVAGIGALLSIVPSFLNGGTPHAGAASMYSGGAITGTGKEYTSRVAVTDTYQQAMQAPVDSLAMAIGGALDGLAKRFEKAAGYSVQVGFKSDNDDPSVGQFRVRDASGQILREWEAYQRGELGARATGERYDKDPTKGFDQYLQSVTAATIPIVQGIVPGWADSLLDQLSTSLGIAGAIAAGDKNPWKQMSVSGQEAFTALQQTLAQIAQIDAAFDALGKTMSIFAGLTDEMKTALLGGLGGMEGFAAAAQTYYAAYYSEQERYTEALARMQEALAGIGVEIDPAMGTEAKAQYRALVESAFADGNEVLATQLLALSGAFAQTADAAQEVTDATQEQAQALTQGAIDLLSRLPGGAAEARNLQAQMLAQQASQLLAGVGIADLQSTILQATAADIEGYLREAWGYLDTLEAKQALIDLGGQLLDFVGDAQSAEEALAGLSDVMRGLLTERKRLEAEMLRASGDDAGYAQALRAIATEGYTEAEIAAWDYNQALRAQISALDAAQQAQEDAARQQLATARQVVEGQRQLAMDAAAAVREQISAVQSRIRELESEADWVRTQAGMGYGQAGVGAADKFTASLYSGYEGYAANMAALAQQYDGMAQAQKDMLAELETEESRHKGTVQRLESILSEEKTQVTQLMSLNTAIGVLQSAVVGAINGSGTVQQQPSPPVATKPVGKQADQFTLAEMRARGLGATKRGESIYGPAIRDDGAKFAGHITGQSLSGGGAAKDTPTEASTPVVPDMTIADYKQLAQLQQQYWQLRGDEESIRAAVLDNMHLQLRPVQQQIWAQEALNTVTQQFEELNPTGKLTAIKDEAKDFIEGLSTIDASTAKGKKTLADAKKLAFKVEKQRLAEAREELYSSVATERWNVNTGLRDLRKDFKDLGIAMPTTVEGFRALIDATTDESLKDSLLELAPAFAEATNAAEALAQKNKELYSGLLSERALSDLDTSDVTEQFKELGYTLPKSSEELKSWIDKLPTGDLKDSLLALVPSFAEATNAAEALAQKNKELYSNLLTPDEVTALKVADLRKDFAELGYVIPTTKEAFRNLLDTLADGELKDSLLELVPAFASIEAAAVEASAKSLSAAWASVGTASGWAAEYLGDGRGLESMLATVRESYAGAQTVQQREAALGQIINLEQQLFNLEQKRQEGAIEAAQKAADAAREQLEAVSKTLQAAQALGDYAQKMMYGEQSGLSDADRFAALGAEYASLLARARGGDAEAMQELPGVTSDYLGLAQELAVSQADYSVLSGRIAAELAATGAVQEASAKTQGDMLQAQVDSAQEQIKALQKQFDVSNETKALIDQQLTDAQAQYEDQRAKVQDLIDQGADTNLLLGALPGELGGMILPAINAATAAAQAAGAIAAAAQSAAAAAAASAAASSAGIPTPADLLTPLPRPERVLPTPIKAFASGGLHTGGLRLVGERGPELEVTGPARYFDASKTAAMLSGGRDAELVAEIRALREQNARLEERLQGIERSSQQLADQFDNVTVGGNAMAVEIMA